STYPPHHLRHDHEFVRNPLEGERLEKRPPSGAKGCLRALDPRRRRDPENPAVWTGFFHVPSVSGVQLKRRWNMTDLRQRLQGLWLPLVTPFRDGRLDERSLRQLTRHYAGEEVRAVDGFILGATSGEGMTLRPFELERLLTTVREELAAH